MPLRCDNCSRIIDTSIEKILFYCGKCKPPKIYCSTCEREKLPRPKKNKVVCPSCEKPVKLVKNLKKLPKELTQRATDDGAVLEIVPEVEVIEGNEFIQSYGQFCAECGTQLVDGAQWCPECGQKVN
ncbi:MAG: zinc-ribbon domain-containing protein [Promethearchaeota archaeon]|nr:MAG: zinc-ribbon domain-containing protein [Candidatus Lokiarchaeota archaeon]